ncbi:hypothetical protein ACFX15_035210 [Malus domestica]
MAEQGGEDEAELRSTDASATEGTVVERTSLGMETTWCTNHHLGSNLQRGMSRRSRERRGQTHKQQLSRILLLREGHEYGDEVGG